MQQHRYRLALTYSLFSLEMLGSLLRPFFLGLAVNDLIKGSYEGLIKLCAVHFLWLLIGTFRHMFDTRTYSAIYTSMVTQFLARKYEQKDVSRLSAHSTLSREFVDFLEFDLAYIVEALYNIIGSMILLSFYDSSIVAVCLAILVPVMAISYRYGKKMKRLTKLKNDELEKQVNIISDGNQELIKNHYGKLRKWQIKISDKEAWNFGIMEVMVILVIAFSLLVSKNILGTTIMAGTIIGIYNYLLKFVSGLDTIPYIVQRFSTLQDITRRIELQAEDFPSTPPRTPEEKFSLPGFIKLSA